MNAYDAHYDAQQVAKIKVSWGISEETMRILVPLFAKFPTNSAMPGRFQSGRAWSVAFGRALRRQRGASFDSQSRWRRDLSSRQDVAPLSCLLHGHQHPASGQEAYLARSRPRACSANMPGRDWPWPICGSNGSPESGCGDTHSEYPIQIACCKFPVRMFVSTKPKMIGGGRPLEIDS